MVKDIELEEAREIILGNMGELKIQEQKISHVCGKVLAQDLIAPINVPEFSKSLFDGFALRASDTSGASLENPIVLEIIDEIPAGDTRRNIKVPFGSGVKILTGAPLPKGIDVVIKKEDIDYLNGEISLTKELSKGTNIFYAGAELQKGERIFRKGEVLGPYHIGVLSALGLEKILIYQTPKIGLISTGDELKMPGEKLEYGQIYNSNIYTLEALIKRQGGRAFNLGTVPDDLGQIGQILCENCENYDLLITTGGASFGDYDLIEKVLRVHKGEILFNRIRIKPGSFVICGILKGKLIIGLSGNPSAALISFELLVRPLLKKLRGIRDVTERYLQVELSQGFPKKVNQRRFLRVKVNWKEGKWVAYQKEESSILMSMIGYNALIDIPGGAGPIAPKAIVKALLLEDD